VRQHAQIAPAATTELGGESNKQAIGPPSRHRIKKLLDFKERFKASPKYCTMYNGTELCAIKQVNRYGKEYHKLPKLVELYHHLFQETPFDLHNALQDVMACVRCYWKMKYHQDKRFVLKKDIDIDQDLIHCFRQIQFTEPRPKK
jgi:DNA polymerase III epsilon subunit-like protein